MGYMMYAHLVYVSSTSKQFFLLKMTNIYTRYFKLISLIFLSIVIPNRQIFKSFGRTISNISSIIRPVLFEIKYFGDVSLFRNKT